MNTESKPTINVCLGTILQAILTQHEDVLSFLTIDVYIKEIHSIIELHERGTIEQLSEKFRFHLDEENYDTSNMDGKPCRIGVDKMGFYFLSWVI